MLQLRKQYCTVTVEKAKKQKVIIEMRNRPHKQGLYTSSSVCMNLWTRSEQILRFRSV
jgi:hypothetical protein